MGLRDSHDGRNQLTVYGLVTEVGGLEQSLMSDEELAKWEQDTFGEDDKEKQAINNVVDNLWINTKHS